MSTTTRAWRCPECMEPFSSPGWPKDDCPSCSHIGGHVEVYVCPVDEAVQLRSATPSGHDLRLEPRYVIPAPEERSRES